MFFRKIGALIRGKATPFQLLSACVLGATLGFMPGVMQAPGLIAALTLLLIVLNANLFLAAIVGAGARLLSLLAAPLIFGLGRFLLDGPLRGLFESLINAPVLALFGFEYYLTSGGLLAGLVVGLITGLVVVKLITGYRRKMVDLEKNSEKFRAYADKRWVKILTFVLVGGGPGKNVTYEALLKRNVGNPIRLLGAVFAVLVVVLLFLAQAFARGPIITAVLQSGLEKVNGATVDLASADLDLKGGRLTLNGLAMSDPERLDTDLFRATTLEADISTANLLRKRLHLDRVVIRDASHGEKRSVPGRRLVKETPIEDKEESSPAGTKGLEEYLRDAQVWKERLSQARRWIEKISGPAETEVKESGQAVAETESLAERLERQVRELGYRRVRADHLIRKTPTFSISELLADQVRLAGFQDETLRISGQHLSTHPALLGQATRIEVASSKDTLGFTTVLGQFAPTPTNNTLALHYHGLATDDVAGQLKLDGENPIRGGTIDLDAQGTWTTAAGVSLQLPLRATLHQVTFAMPGLKPTQVDRLEVPITLEGRLDRPRVRVDDQGLANALVKAGVKRATEELKTRAVEKLAPEVQKRLGQQGSNLLKGVLGGEKK
jgi:uncharacterized protein (TIGR03546 family)